MHGSTGNPRDPGCTCGSGGFESALPENITVWACGSMSRDQQAGWNTALPVKLDVLVFWRGHCSAYPLLYMLTLELLCLPTKSSSSECAFCFTGCVLKAHRNRLNPGTMDFFSTVRPNTRLKHWVVWHIRLLFWNSPPLRCDKCIVHVWERGSSFIPLIFHLLFLA